MEFSNLTPEVQQSLLAGHKLIAHASSNYDMHISTAEPVAFSGFSPLGDYEMLLCHACTAFVDEGTFHIISVQVPQPPTPDTDALTAAMAALLHRNYRSAVAARKDGTAWAEAIFLLERGYERRMAAGDEWEEFENCLYEAVQDLLTIEREVYEAAQGAHS